MQRDIFSGVSTLRPALLEPEHWNSEKETPITIKTGFGWRALCPPNPWEEVWLRGAALTGSSNDANVEIIPWNGESDEPKEHKHHAKNLQR
jgi:hypothetical protein